MIYDFVVVGAGQAGLSIGYYLKSAGFNFLIVDADNEIGSSWLKRWDSLTLFTPSQYNGLPGMAFPMADGQYPDKNAVADYLKNYVETFALPVRLNCQVQQTIKVDGRYFVETDNEQIQTDNVIVATGPFHTPHIPACSQQISSDVVQLHSSEYKNTDQLQAGDTLVVGAGDSGVQILSEIADTKRKVYFSGQSRAMFLPQEILGKTLWWWLSKLGILSLNKYSWLGKKLRNAAQPIIGSNLKKILGHSNVSAIGRTLGVKGDTIEFEKAQLDSIKNIVWATGFRPDFSWISDVSLDEHGYPENYRGIGKQDGLYFIGLPWMHTRGSATLGGVQLDAAHLFDHLLTSCEETFELSEQIEVTSM
jgi:putative flavoprotein involved in K+ transport